MRNNVYKPYGCFPSSPRIPQSQVMVINDSSENEYQSNVPQTQRNSRLRETISYKNKSPFVMHQNKDEGQRSMQNFYKRSRAGEEMGSVGLAVSTVKKVAEDNIKLVEERQALFKKNCELVNEINALKKKSNNEQGTKKQFKEDSQEEQDYHQQNVKYGTKNPKLQSSIMDIRKPYSSIITEDQGVRNTPVNKFNQQTHQQKFFKNKHRYIDTEIIRDNYNNDNESTENNARPFMPKQSYVMVDANIRPTQYTSPKLSPYKFKIDQQKYCDTNKYTFPSEEQLYLNEKTTPYPSNAAISKGSRLIDKAMSPTLHHLPFSNSQVPITKCVSINCLSNQPNNYLPDQNNYHQNYWKNQNNQHRQRKSSSPFNGSNKLVPKNCQCPHQRKQYTYSDKYIIKESSPYSPKSYFGGITISNIKSSEVINKKQPKNNGSAKEPNQKRVQTIQEKIRRVKYENSQLRNQMLN